MTKKLYYTDSYLTDFTATVLSCNEGKKGYEVVLDQTAFYPEGGGQPSDEGILGGVKVKDVRIKDHVIYHIVECPLEVGNSVEGKIDFDKRFDMMQQHSGEHIISGLINKHYGYNNVGFHLSRENMTADVDGELTSEQVSEIEYLANEAIYKNIPVQGAIYGQEEVREMTYRSKIELNEDVRLVTIPGYDTCACCGTHVKYTGEIGMIKFISSERHRGGTRLTLACGKRALKDYSKKQEIVSSAMAILSAKPEMITSHLQKLQEEFNETKFKLAEVKGKLFSYKVEEYIKCNQATLCICEEGLVPEELRKLCTLLIQKVDKTCLVVTPDATGFKYALGNSQIDIRPLCKAMNMKFQGKGGGSSELCQGSLLGEWEEIKLFLSE
ncbi:alanyl-tRNA editing protein [Cellulosilyticum sp. ST5]|uniref:alanyl-tRNA editing protein n=1 Tax=unclassified Cellulosilyticum TaxID=2643091 RepID=UPI000F8DCF01|nr:alanyl-tRNA editing protein [Cellulosilyticum sp. WCF-2]QEH68291.1 alanyl-tRNA editing protein [Cellulosilyticum sp. WCF-2]